MGLLLLSTADTTSLHLSGIFFFFFWLGTYRFATLIAGPLGSFQGMGWKERREQGWGLPQGTQQQSQSPASAERDSYALRRLSLASFPPWLGLSLAKVIDVICL